MTDDEWISTLRINRGCAVCNDPDLPKLKALLALVAKHHATVSRPQVYERMCEISPKFGIRVGFSSLRRHLAEHEGVNTDGRRRVDADGSARKSSPK